MRNQTDKPVLPGLSCFLCVVTAALVLTAACKITPPDGVFGCRDGKCPDGQRCDRDSMCRSQPLASPDTGVFDLPDSDVRLPDAGTATVDLCGGRCTEDKPVCLAGVCKACDPEAADTCVGDQPLVCTNEGTKELRAACGGDKPVCNNGVCGALRLRGGLGAAGQLPKSAEGVRLREHTLTLSPELCADIRGERICLRGGLQP